MIKLLASVLARVASLSLYFSLGRARMSICQFHLSVNLRMFHGPELPPGQPSVTRETDKVSFAAKRCHFHWLTKDSCSPYTFACSLAGARLMNVRAYLSCFMLCYLSVRARRGICCSFHITRNPFSWFMRQMLMCKQNWMLPPFIIVLHFWELQ